MALSRRDWRLAIGPRVEVATSPYYFDWTSTIVFSGGDPFESTVNSAYTRLDTTLTVANGTSFASKGGVWVSGGATGNTWEYLSYTGKSGNNLTGVVADLDLESNGNHAVGATVKPYRLIETDDGVFNVRKYFDADLSFWTWEASVAGINIPQVIIRNRHIARLLTRTPGGSWLTSLTGMIVEPKVSDTSKHTTPWSFKIVPCGTHILQKRTSGVRRGEYNIATASTATSATALGAAWKEKDSGDFVAASPDFSANSVLDESLDTVHIGDKYLGGDNEPRDVPADPQWGGATNDMALVDQVHISQPPGQPPGYRWLQVTILQSEGFGDDFYIRCGDGKFARFNSSVSSVDSGDHKTIIVCENRELFNAENPSAAPDQLIEQTESETNEANVVTDLFNHLPASGGGLALVLRGSPGVNHHTIEWGTGPTDPTWHDTAWGNKKNWTGSRIAAPADGQTMRYDFDTTPNASEWSSTWIVDNISYPGYDLEAAHTPPHWIKVDLPSLGLQLTDAATASSPASGNPMNISDASGPSTRGLPSSGTIQISNEQITYTSKSATAISGITRGANSTTAEAHSAGDVVYLVDSSVITDAHPIENVQIQRRSGGIDPTSVSVYGSKFPTSPRNPDQAGWEADWTTLHTTVSVSGDSHTFALTSAQRRMKALLLRIHTMSTDSARSRLNVVKLPVYRAEYDTANWSSSTDAGVIMRTVAVNAGFPTGNVVLGSSLPTVVDGVTANDTALNVLLDMAKRHAMVVYFDENSNLNIENSTFWTASSFTATQTWSKSTAVNVAFTMARTNSVSQVKIKYDSDASLAVYPSSADDLGSLVEEDGYVFSNSTAANNYAKNRYILAAYPYTAVVANNSPSTLIDPGEIHQVQWLLDVTMEQIDRTYIVTASEYEYRNGALYENVVSLKQINREMIS